MALDILLHKAKGKYMVRHFFLSNLGSGETEQTTKSKWYYPHSTDGKLHLGGIKQVLQNSKAGLELELWRLCSLVLS